MLLSQQQLKKHLTYNPETGDFIWRLMARESGIAGSIDANGYQSIGLLGKYHKAHRLAFLYMEGYFPEHDVDHKNGIRNDNRWINLRHATRSCNMQNQRIRPDNKSYFPGVRWYSSKSKWRTNITINRKQIHLGYYTDLLEAALTRLTAEVQCSSWTCNHQNNLVKRILIAWPDFNIKSLA
jgi:hypothetical protein